MNKKTSNIKRLLFLNIFFTFFLSNNLYAWGTGSNEPNINISSASTAEGDTGTTNLTFTVSIDECPDTQPIKLKWETNDGGSSTATSGNDYSYGSGTFEFIKSGWGTSCTKTKDIVVSITSDIDFEPNETFKVILSDNGTDASQKYKFTNAQGIGTIENDDVSSVNTPPIANANVDQSLPEDENATLNGSLSIDNSGISSYSWSINGEHVTTGEYATVPSSWLKIGHNTVVLTVTATDDGATDHDTMIINIMETVNNVDDLCYEDSTYTGMMCMDMGVCKGGAGCTTGIPLKNIGDSNLSDAHVYYDENGIGGTMMGNCKVSPEGNCSQESAINMGPMGMLGTATVFDFENDIAPDDSDAAVSTTAMIAMSCLNSDNLYGSYIKDNKYYRGQIPPCDAVPVSKYTTGPFDAWDTFRGIEDRNISTKIVGKNFDLRIASINSSNDGTESLEGKECFYRLYNKDTNTNLTSWVSFDSEDSATQDEQNINIDKAYSSIYVKFKFCQKKNVTPIELGSFEDCGTNPQHYIYNTSTLSSDSFAIRPKEFTFDIVEGEVFTADKAKDITFRALDEGNGDTSGYNESENTSFRVDLNLTKPNIDCKYQSSENSSNIVFDEGKITKNISFNHIGEYNLTIAEVKDCSSRFAKVDCDDKDVSGKWSLDSDLSINPKMVKVKIIPKYFEIISSLSDHHMAADNNFTYLSNDLNVSSFLDLNITAKSELDKTMKNYTSKCYAHNVDLNISLVTDPTTTTPNVLNKIIYKITEKESSEEIKDESLDINKIDTIITKEMFPKADYNGTAVLKMNFNFDRKYNEEINPFKLKITDINITDKNDSGNLVLDKTGINAPLHESTFFYARVKSSLSFYDDISSNSINTPISVVVYSGAGTTATFDLSIFKSTENFEWYLATQHNPNTDGNITLTSQNADPVGISSGIDSPKVNVLKPSGTLPIIVDVNLSGTSNWLIYNPDSNSKPSPFYRVRFIDGSSGWAGHGSTGHVMGGSANRQKNRQIEW